MKILAYQLNVSGVNSIDARRSHIANLARMLEKKLTSTTDVALVVLPELSTIEYSPEAFKKLPELAESIKGETFEELSACASRLGCAIAYGFPREEEGGYYISQVVVGPKGEYLTHYDKIHLAQFGASAEQTYFRRGNKLGIFDLHGLRFGLTICYDFRFPDLTQLMVDRYGISAVIHPVAFTRDGTYTSWPHFVICRALENQVYFFSVNRAGEDWGGSIMCPPWFDDQIRPIVLGSQEEMRCIEIDKELIEGIRARYPFRQDRLPDYSVLESN